MLKKTDKKEKWEMANGNTSWIDPMTKNNITLIYRFLADETRKASKEGKKRPCFNYSQIAKAIRKQRIQVSFACQKLAFAKEPFLRIEARSFRSHKGGKITEKVHLIRFTNSKN